MPECRLTPSSIINQIRSMRSFQEFKTDIIFFEDRNLKLELGNIASTSTCIDTKEVSLFGKIDGLIKHEDKTILEIVGEDNDTNKKYVDILFDQDRNAFNECCSKMVSKEYVEVLANPQYTQIAGEKIIKNYIYKSIKTLEENMFSKVRKAL